MEQSNFYTRKTLPQFDKARLDKLPDIIGKYKIHTLLHQGGGSIVYIGSLKDKLLAIKVLSTHLSSREDLVDKFIEESKILSLVNHPNVVKFYGSGKWERGLYIAMELAQGIPLTNLIKKKRLSFHARIDLILQISLALLNLHSNGVVHRDLKPENIIIDRECNVKLVDFGIATLIDETTISKTKAGTPSYMSPEQRNTLNSANFKNDIYALGVIAYELVTGAFSYGKIETSSLPIYIKKIIDKALGKSGSYEDIVDIVDDLNKYMQSKEIESDAIRRECGEIISYNLEEIFKKNLLEIDIKLREIEIGVSYESLPNGGYKIIELNNHQTLIMIARSSKSHLEAFGDISQMSGIFQAMQEQSLPLIASTLKFLSKLDFILLMLDKKNNTFEVFMNNMGPILKHSRSNKVIAPIFMDKKDSWNTYDTLLINSADIELNNKSIDISSIINKNINLSPTNLAKNFRSNLLDVYGSDFISIAIFRL